MSILEKLDCFERLVTIRQEYYEMYIDAIRSYIYHLDGKYTVCECDKKSNCADCETILRDIAVLVNRYDYAAKELTEKTDAFFTFVYNGEDFQKISDALRFFADSDKEKNKAQKLYDMFVSQNLRVFTRFLGMPGVDTLLEQLKA